MNELQRIQDWYRSQCNEDWEHGFGVRIATLDNPGWIVKVDLRETELAEKAFEPLSRQNPDVEDDWIACKLEKELFVGCGGSDNLTEVLCVFLDWAES